MQLANFLHKTPDSIVVAMRPLAHLLHQTAAELRRFPDPCTTWARTALQRICTLADKVNERNAAPHVDAATMTFARQPAMKAMLIYARQAADDVPLNIQMLRDAAGRDGNPASKRTIEELLRIARTNCPSCDDGSCSVVHRGLFARPVGYRRSHIELTGQGCDCADILLEEDYLSVTGVSGTSGSATP